MVIAVTGGTGFVGRAVLEVLTERGLDVRALARTIPADLPPGQKGIEWVQGDLDNRQALAQLVQGAQRVIHIAGLTNTPDPAQFQLVNVDGTLNVLEAALTARVKRFVNVSSLSVREPQLSAYGASKAKAERLVAASPLDWTSVRPAAIYGPRDTDMLELFKLAKWGVIPMPPPGRTSIIHVRDLAELLVRLVPVQEPVTQQIFEPDDGRARGWSHRELAFAIGWAVGRKPWVPHLSKQMLERLSKAESWLKRDKAKLTADRVGYMVHPDWVCSPNRKVPHSLWRPRIDTREGLKGTAQWYRDRKWL